MKQFIGALLMVLTMANCPIRGQVVTQTSQDISLRFYVMNVHFIGQRTGYSESGILFALTDSSVVLAPKTLLKAKLNALIRQHNGKLPPTDSLRRLLPLRTYRYDKLSRLSLHRKGNVAKGLLLGVGAGILAGLIEGNDIIFPVSFYAVAYTALLAPVGLLIGAACTKSINARKQSVATEAKGRFLKFTLVEQVNKANLYTP